MTVGYLKEQLENYPDDTRILLDDGPIYMIKEPLYRQNVEVIDIYSIKVKIDPKTGLAFLAASISIEDMPEFILLQTRIDFDYMHELHAKLLYLRDEKKAPNWKEILLAQGFTEDEIERAGKNGR